MDGVIQSLSGLVIRGMSPRQCDEVFGLWPIEWLAVAIRLSLCFILPRLLLVLTDPEEMGGLVGLDEKFDTAHSTFVFFVTLMIYISCPKSLTFEGLLFSRLRLEQSGGKLLCLPKKLTVQISETIGISIKTSKVSPRSYRETGSINDLLRAGPGLHEIRRGICGRWIVPWRLSLRHLPIKVWKAWIVPWKVLYRLRLPAEDKVCVPESSRSLH